MGGTRRRGATGALMPAVRPIGGSARRSVGRSSGRSVCVHPRHEVRPRAGGEAERGTEGASGVAYPYRRVRSGLDTVPLLGAVTAAVPRRLGADDLCHAFFSLNTGHEKSAAAGVVASLARGSATDGGNCRRYMEDPQNRRRTTQSRQGIAPSHRARSPCPAGRGGAPGAQECGPTPPPCGARVCGGETARRFAVGTPSLPVESPAAAFAAPGTRARIPGYRRVLAVVRAHGPPPSATGRAVRRTSVSGDVIPSCSRPATYEFPTVPR